MQHFDVLGMCIPLRVLLGCTRVYTYRRGLRCCLFRVEGNSRALLSGTAIVQSRFFVV